MRTSFGILLILILLWRGAADASRPCDLRKKLGDIALNQNVKLKPGEKESYGMILSPGKKIPHLQDGTHVFVIESDGSILISPRYPDLDEVAPVVTHRSLLNRFREIRGREPGISGIGEINVDHGMISSINNKAGTAFMSEDQLPLVADYLKKCGLPVTRETPLIPYQSVASGHDAEHVLAAFRIQTLKDPVLSRINEKLLRFRKETQIRFPSKEFPGQVDWMAFLKSPARKTPPIGLDELTTHQMRAMSSLSWMESFSDRYRMLPILRKEMTDRELEEVIEGLPRLEGVFDHH